MPTNEQPSEEDSEEIPLIVHPAIINRSAKEFSDSILSGDFYKGLKGEDKRG
ncbi:MAG: hypothetical protein IPL26_22905 [Leptospiraceae bacterium]|nr:hypothetical protein [Leptospiraceae bacterium]